MQPGPAPRVHRRCNLQGTRGRLELSVTKALSIIHHATYHRVVVRHTRETGAVRPTRAARVGLGGAGAECLLMPEGRGDEPGALDSRQLTPNSSVHCEESEMEILGHQLG
jgi:hypothetical protein